MPDTEAYYQEATTQPGEPDDAASQIAALRMQVAALANRASELAGETGEAIDEAVRENTYLSLGLALIAGVAIGFVLKR